MDFKAACGPLLSVSIAILINPDIIEFLFHNKKSDIISNHLSQVHRSTVTSSNGSFRSDTVTWQTGQDRFLLCAG